jgi:hypothetical protein
LPPGSSRSPSAGATRPLAQAPRSRRDHARSRTARPTNRHTLLEEVKGTRRPGSLRM